MENKQKMKCTICESKICLVVCGENIVCMTCLTDGFKEYMKQNGDY